MEFPVTIWTLIHQAHLNGDMAARSALEVFCEQYRQPVVHFLRLRGVIENRVEDLAHDFLLHMMETDSLRHADPSKGRFRTYLLASLRHFMASDIREQQALKRGGGRVHVSLDLDGMAEFIPDLTDPEVSTHDRVWAINLLVVAYAHFEREIVSKGKAARLTLLKPFILPGKKPPPVKAVAGALNLDESHVRTEISRFRNRFREIFREEVARTVETESDVDDEIQYLREVLKNPGLVLPD